MSLKRLALPAALAALTSLAWSTEASAASVETYRLTNVTHDWQSIGLSSAAQGGVLLAQTISELGWDAGTARIDDSFRLRFQESDNGNHDLGEEAAVVSFIGSLSSLGITGESGTFWMSTQSRATTHTIRFQRTYTHPVVFVQAVSALGSDPVAVIPYVTTGDFAVIGMPEGASYDGIHYANEKVQYVVVEAGTYLLRAGSDGTSQYLVAGVENVTTSNYSNTGMTDITPSSVLFWDSTTALIAQPQSVTSAVYRGTRVQRTVDSYGFLSGVSVRHMLDRTVEHPSAGSAPTTTGPIGYLAVGTGFETTGELTATANPIYATEVLSGTSNELTAETTTVSTTTVKACVGSNLSEYLLTSSDDWGGSVFGAGYEAKAGIGSTANTGYKLWMGAQATADATVFSASFEVFDGGAASYKVSDTSSSSKAWIDLLGTNVWQQSLSASVTKEYSRTFFEAEADFYGIELEAGASGAVGITAGVSLSGTTVTFSAEPYANLQASVGVGVGALNTDVSVEGTLTLVEVGVPASGSYDISTSIWSYSADLDITSLDGSLDLVGEVLGVEVFSYELYSWDGYTLYHDNLISDSGCI